MEQNKIEIETDQAGITVSGDEIMTASKVVQGVTFQGFMSSDTVFGNGTKEIIRFCSDGQIVVAPDVKADEAAQVVIDQLKRLWGNLAAENERLKYENEKLKEEVDFLDCINKVLRRII